MRDPITSSDFAIPPLEVLADLLPAYEFVGFIAQGGMGAIYEARQRSLERPVAIKILPRSLGDDPVFRASFEAEAKAMARLNHPNLVGIYDFGEVDGMLFIVMEYVAGKSLHHSAFGRAIDPAEAAEIVAGICSGLDHAHRNGVLHRDIKPGNILLDSRAKPKIADFGLALPIGDRAGDDDAIYGTPGYTAPEVYERQPASPRSDIFSVGIVLYELLVGHLPDERRVPPSRCCNCPQAFDAIFARANHAIATMRFSSAAEFGEQLGAAATARHAPPRRLAVVAQAPSPVSKLPAAGLAVRPLPSRPTLPLGFAMVAIVIAVAAVVISQSGSGEGGASARPKTNLAPPAAAAEELSLLALAGGEDPFADDPPTADAVIDENTARSPLGDLARLKAKLAGGARDEFPASARPRGGSYFVLVDQPMTWLEARRFSEAHGGHLAVLRAAEDRRWFAGEFEPASPVWLGGGVAARQQWGWIDGGDWVGSIADPPADDRPRFLLIDPSSQLAAAPGSEPHEFAIQWRGEGIANPATLAEELRRAAQSIDAGGLSAARLPVGTQIFAESGSHFFPLPTGLAWEEARVLAKAAGGYLAVPSTSAESAWLRSRFGAEGADFLWIGGYRMKPDDPWRWLTREAWTFYGWSGHPDPTGVGEGGDRMMLALGNANPGWIVAAGQDGGALGALIEWSAPKKRAAVEHFDPEAWLATVDQKMKLRLESELVNFGAKRDEAIERYVRAMKREARRRKSDRFQGFPGRGGARPDRGGWGAWGDWRGEKAEATVDSAMEKVVAAKALVIEIPEFAPDEFREIHGDATSGLQQLIAGRDKSLQEHSTMYASGLAKQAVALRSSGHEAAAAMLLSRSELGEEVDGFLGLLGINPQ